MHLVLLLVRIDRANKNVKESLLSKIELIYGSILREFIMTSRNPSNPKDWYVSRLLWGWISFLLQNLPVKIIITYLIRVFDTTWESKFWALKFLFLG